jgi:hypothetical protein
MRRSSSPAYVGDMTEIIAGYRVQKLEDGTTALVEPGPSWAAGGFGIFWGGIGVWAILTPSGWDAGAATPFFLLLGWVLPGAWMVWSCLRWVIYEKSWLLRGGEIALRRRLHGVSIVHGGRFEPVLRTEIRHGVWKTGRGSTDIFRFYVDGARRPTALAERETSSVEPDEEILALGQLVASRVGRKLVVMTETIKEPSHGD